jgi:DNA topoisomerase-3
MKKVLTKRFGFAAFRPFQEAVCEAVVAGQDTLLVMPTGAGKSLCYQLPGIARGGTTLVISPLIALIEDQVEKLAAMGFRAERIHSGLTREHSREVCRRYLAGDLDFLFIAPERLAVAGFPEFLARRPLALIAVDEAHCISHWGHDFRPEYRLLGERLPILRPAPIIAMTATATTLVQEDIVQQLALRDPQRFIHGFRRTNIGIEIVQVQPTARNELVVDLLTDPARRPAIVYCPTRAKTDELGRLLAANLPAAAYHAGMPPKDRDEVQTAFLGGRLQVIVATIAFGMGVDKADVRTVIHTAMPSSLEGYYQEVGRAGRDGKPSRAILLHSYADRHLQKFFLEKAYPEVGVLKDLYLELGPQPEPRELLQERFGKPEDEFQAALEKLWIHGGAGVSSDDLVTRGHDRWQASYVMQKKYRAEQLELVFGFAEGNQCRMGALVRHFGDKSDDGHPCGLCDCCAPGEVVAGRFRAPDAKETSVMLEVLEKLKLRNGATTGQLFTDCAEGRRLDRNQFEKLLDAMVRGGLISLLDDSFVREGHTIRFRRAELESQGRHAGAAIVGSLELSSLGDGAAKPVKATKARASVSRRSRAAKEEAAPEAPPAAEKPTKTKARGRKAAVQPDQPLDQDEQLFEKLRAWRLAEAKRRHIPPFQVLTDRTLRDLATARPSSLEDLLQVSGIGPSKAQKYGDKVLQVIAEN